MPKYCWKQIFAHGRFPEVGQKQKTDKKGKRERERLIDSNNNGQASARKHAWRTQAAWANCKLLNEFGESYTKFQFVGVESLIFFEQVLQSKSP